MLNDGVVEGVVDLVGTNGGATSNSDVNGGVVESSGATGGAQAVTSSAVDGGAVGDSDVATDVYSYFLSSSFPPQVETTSLADSEADLIQDHWLHVPALADFSCDNVHALHVSTHVSPPLHHRFNLSKAPFSFSEAIAWPDASVWRSTMDHEKSSLDEMGAFEEADLPAGERPIRLKWVFAHKTDSAGVNILGKEKARLVAQGFNQCPVRDLEIYQFNCKMAFLHAKIHHPIYARQIPGYPHSNSKKVLRILVALYSLRQSAFEFYTLFSSLLISLRMLRCEVDHGVFFGEWASSPDPLIPLLVDGNV